MVYFIIGCILALLVIVSIPLLCFYLIKRSDSGKKKITWQIYAIVITIFIVGIAAIAFIFIGGSHF